MSSGVVGNLCMWKKNVGIDTYLCVDGRNISKVNQQHRRYGKEQSRDDHNGIQVPQTKCVGPRFVHDTLRHDVLDCNNLIREQGNDESGLRQGIIHQRDDAHTNHDQKQRF